ncbi:hypothetical protein M0R45_020900 [Rubus argutus]|uniref:KRR-R motif-containing protein 1 n=1 Tax=Rubus argutus TaxID=59490 RepID=A0AAW1X9X5_RUBAR
MANGVVEQPKLDHMEVEKVGRSSRTLRVISYTDYFGDYHVPKLIQAWPMVESALEEHGISCKLNLVKHYMRVSTTKRTRDPDIIDRAREFIQVLSKTEVPPPTAIRILNGELHHEYIKTGSQEGGLCSIHGIKKDRFVRQRTRFRDNKKELARLLGCGLYLNGNSVTAVGISLENVKVAKRAVERCIVENVNAADLVKVLDMRLTKALERKLHVLRI